MSTSQGSAEVTSRRFGGVAATLACLLAALSIVLLSSGTAHASGSTIMTVLNNKGGDSAADSSGSIYAEPGDIVEFKAASALAYSISLTVDGGGAAKHVPYSTYVAFSFSSSATYGFSWTVSGLLTKKATFYGRVVVESPATSPPPPPPTSASPTQGTTSGHPSTGAPSTSPVSVSDSASASGSAGASGSAISSTGPSGSSTSPAGGGAGITFPAMPNTSIPTGGFAGPGSDPGTSVPDTNDPLPNGKGTVASGTPVALGSNTAVPSDSGAPSAAGLPTPSSSSSTPTGLAIIAIVALSLVFGTYFYQRLSRRA